MKFKCFQRKQWKYHHTANKITLAALLCLSSLTSTANEQPIFFVTEHLPPYQIVDEKNNVSGFAVDIIHELAKRSGSPYQINAYPWVRSYNLTQQKANHCIFSIARIPAREDLFAWIGTLTEVNNAVVWGLKSNDIPVIDNIEQVKKYLTAVNKNDVTHLGLLERGFVEKEHLYVLNNTDSLINLLVTRPEINFIVADDITIGYRAQLAGVDINHLQRVFEIKDLTLNFYLACNKGSDKAVLENLTKNLRQIHKDGFYQRTLARWKDRMIHID